MTYINVKEVKVMDVELTILHGVYLGFIILIIGFMAARRDTNMLCLLGIALFAFIAKGTISDGVSAIFNALVFAGSELFGIILIISVIVAMSRIMEEIGANAAMVAPVLRFIKTPDQAFWGIGIIMLIASWFFWPSPAVALVGAVLLPVALRAGLPAMGAAMAMNLFGHGIALSSDFFIQGAPTLTAKAAGLPVSDVITASVPLIAVMGISTTLTAFYLLKKDMQAGSLMNTAMEEAATQETLAVTPLARCTAVLVPLLFILDVIIMAVYELRGGDATALVGGTAVLILIAVSWLQYRAGALDKITEHFVSGLGFGIKVFGPVIPIAAFFFLGDAPIKQILGDVLPLGSKGILGDLGQALAGMVPVNKVFAATVLTTAGMITGLDGSGFSGISLVGSLGKLFGTAIQGGTATLTALGQIGAIWVGGGTLIPWGLIPAAAICGVNPIELARRNFVPVCVGLIVTTIVAMLII
jgi:hypothetical protein